jgi:predicted AAA+ superfamily ATPase
LRQGQEPHYFAQAQKEVDFVVGGLNESQQSAQPIEVKYVDQIEPNDKRLAGLRLFLRQHNESQSGQNSRMDRQEASHGASQADAQPRQPLVITKSFEAQQEIEGQQVEFKPLWQWLAGF